MEGKNQLTNTTEVIKSIPELIDAITEVVQTPSGFLILVLVLAWFVFNRDYSHIFNFLERKENKRLERLESYISSNSYSTNCLEVVKEQRDTHYFKVATGIYAEKTLRDAYIDLHNSTSHRISWITIRRSLPYLKLDEENNAYIRSEKWHEKLGIYYNYLVAIISFLLSISIILVMVFATELDSITTIKSIVLILISTGTTVFSLSQNSPYLASKRIKKEIEVIAV
ncbi:hypothetical protein LRP50_25080 [Enterovibrio sp. ZSDZ42]|uniref:SMODS and SLOG-associating 2TM effector domain-containing protein n=1 Tax=Enterovibrio gelatinilyticus TaxID=2899819 RepID=A0ABT5R861_9GAMM|nr:hypothetical protein [Enterovibrio sp. ZSDZ42]MDD1796395.1 hypothetical protein [Enterovibrio sp. ZSDZ42]